MVVDAGHASVADRIAMLYCPLGCSRAVDAAMDATCVVVAAVVETLDYEVAGVGAAVAVERKAAY